MNRAFDVWVSHTHRPSYRRTRADDFDYTNRRRHPRFRGGETADLEVSIGKLGNRLEPSETVDIGPGGMSVRLDRRWSVGDECLVRFPAEVSGRIRPRAVLGRVVWVRGSRRRCHMGISFQRPLERLELGDGDPGGPSRVFSGA